MAAKKTAAKGAKRPKTKLTGPPRKPEKYMRTVPAGGNAPEWDSEDAELANLDLGPEIDVEEAQAEPDAPPLRRLPPAPKRGTPQTTIFPNPGGFKLAWDKFSRYWSQCYGDPQLRQRLKVYIYRLFPAMLEGQRQVEILTGIPDQDHQEAKPLTIEDILHRYGTGDYHFKINDGGAGSKPVCQCNLTGRSELRDWDHYPPILDMDGLDVSDPINNTYIKAMKSKKRWDNDDEKEETMAQMDKLERAYERMLKMKDENKDTRDEGKSVEVMAHAAKRAIDLVADSKQGSRGDSSQGVEVFVGVATALAELLKSTKGEPGQTEVLMQIMKQASDAERSVLTSQLDVMREEMRAMREERRQDQLKVQNPLQPTEPDDPFKNLRQLAELREIFQDTFNPGSSRPSKFGWLETVAPIAMQVISPLAQAATYYFQAQAASLRGEHPPAPPTPQQMNPQVGPGAPQADTGPTPQDFEHFMAELTPRLLKFINDPQRTGADFADFFIDWQSDATYDQLVTAAPTPPESAEAILVQLRTYEPLWRHLASRESYVRQFLMEFVTAFDEPQETGTAAPNGAMAGGSGSMPATGWTPNHESAFEAPPQPAANPGASRTPRRTSVKTGTKKTSRATSAKEAD